MDINEKILKISNAGVNIPEELELGHRYSLKGLFDVIDITDRDNQNGTKNRIYKVRSNGEMELELNGKIVKAKEKSSQSKKLHGALWNSWNSDEIENVKNFDDYYNEKMFKIRKYLPDILEMIKNRP